MVDEEVGHGRHQEDGHGTLLLDHLEPASGVEARLVDDLETHLHRRVDERDAGKGEQRAGVHPSGARPVRLHGADHRPVGVTHGHALGPAGGARGVEDVGQVVLVPRRLERRSVSARGLAPAEQRRRAGGPRPASWLPASIRATRPPAAASRSDWTSSPSVTTAVAPEWARTCADLGRGQAGVHGHGHPAGPVGGRIGDQPAQGQLRVQVEADTAARLEAGLEQASGHGVGGAVPLGEGHGADVDHLEGDLVGEFARPCGPGARPSTCEPPWLDDQISASTVCAPPSRGLARNSWRATIHRALWLVVSTPTRPVALFSCPRNHREVTPCGTSRAVPHDAAMGWRCAASG